MTTKDEALKMAIEVLCLVEEYDDNGVNVAKKAINACEEALEPQIELADTISVEDYQKLREQPTNMVTIPLDKLEDMQRRLKRKEWQGLNKYEIIAIDNATNDLMDFARAIEAKLKEENHE